VKQILSFQSRFNDTYPEDEWFGARVSVLPGAKVANGDEEAHFSVEDIWHETPMGYHVRDGGTYLADAVWKSRIQRQKIFGYCPELSMIMPMKLERERCPNDNGEGLIVTPPEAEAVQQKTSGNDAHDAAVDKAVEALAKQKEQNGGKNA
jgi:hypothetical protein